MNKEYDVTVIGAGPGGYVAAIRCAQLGKKVLLIERERLGGVCINWGCIPTKFLIHQSGLFREISENKNLEGPVDKIKLNLKKCQENKKKGVDRLAKGIEFLLKKNKVLVIRGEACFRSPNQLTVKGEKREDKIKTQKVILAMGSSPGSLPLIKADGREVITSKQALETTQVPSRFLVIGAGVIGLEIGSWFNELGSKVTILEIMPQILPGSDKETAQTLQRELKKQGIEILTEMKIQESLIKEGMVTVKGTHLKKDSPFEFKAEKLLLAVGRQPNSKKIKGELPALRLDKAGFVKVNAFMETSIKNIYAIGDLTGGQLLAHKASHEGIIAAENTDGAQKKMDYSAVPSSVFTKPEFSSVGLTEEQARKKYGDDIQTGKFPLRANGRAVTIGNLEGYVKIIAHRNEEIIGAHILSPHSSEMIHEVTLALKYGIKVSELGSVVHVHPTLSESIMESAMNAQNKSIHILNRQ
ncbi:MAG: dihydrolipoyl dehydrogenase [Acidobacteriota bacterium]